MAICEHCGRNSPLITQALNLCPYCIKADFPLVRPLIERAHEKTRDHFGLPSHPPRDEHGLTCHNCANECCIRDGERGYCGVRLNEGGALVGGTPDRGNVSWYYDPLPTNCVADWVCSGGTGAGFPRFAYSDGPEFGFKNLAVFYHACSFNCLFCQNWSFRHQATERSNVSAQELANAVDDHTSCICYFGGDPTPQWSHAIRASRLAVDNTKGRILRICWETNGSMAPSLLKQGVEISLKSGGCIKFDLKTWSEELHIALCGVSNKRTLENFRLLVDYAETRPEPPFLIASTLLIPGYVEKDEVSHIASFIASLDPNIPYTLLGFHPHFAMTDLPRTSKRHAEECLAAAEAQGLKRVRLGNIHLLSSAY